MLNDLLRGVIPALVVSLLVTIIAWRPWRRTPPSTTWGSALAIGAGFIAADIGFRGWHGLAPAAGTNWLMHATALGILAAVFAPLLRPTWLKPIGAVLILAAAVFLIRRRPILTGDTEIITIAALTAAAGAVIWLALRIGARATPGAGPFVVLGFGLLGMSVAIVQSHTLSLGQLTGTLALTTAPLFALGLWRRSWNIAAGAAPVVGVAAASLLLIWRGASDTPSPLSQGLAAAALACPALLALPPLRRRGLWTRIALASLAAGVLAAGAIWRSPSGFDFSGL